MKEHKILIACSVVEKEVQACLPVEGRPENIWIDAGLPADLPRLEQELTRALEDSQLDEAEVQVFFGNRCHPEICRLARRFGAGIAPAKNCIEAFCGENAKKT
jgi:hypothetical protein